MKNQWDAIWINADIATMCQGQAEYGALENSAIAVSEGRISWIGELVELADVPEECAAVVHDCAGQWLSPGLIDCHTHLVWAGSRIREFEMRLQGAGYEQLQKAGGGILSTVQATRSASAEDLFVFARKRIARLKREGITTLEIKSGYGLDVNTEVKMLQVARRLGEEDAHLDIKTSFLGAHALPPEYQNNRQGYIRLIVEGMLPAVAEQGLADAVDGFCEGIGFSPSEIARVFTQARKLDLPVKLHADQLSSLGGAALAAEYAALSADHLEYASEQGISKMADSGTVAVLLPGAFYTLRETQCPPVRLFRDYGVVMALATDANPGSSPVLSLLLILNMACTLFSLTPEEALAGVTRNAACALGLAGDRGTLEVGKRADFALWDIEHPAELAYMPGANPCKGIVKDGIMRPLA